ncbi:DUF4007 family protein [Rhodothalassium salexigens]|nr:DUF4007 family protein [Rhodothalassium salexigens]MBK1637971.1 hypothetical protein [Rhodothalassium salexigens DSM 2132]
MKLGGHETFYPRPGWLTKGLLHLREGGMGVFSAPETADRLGVGRNMAKSIGWWLHATGLATRTSRNSPLELTLLGNVLAEYDPYMVQLGTWWLVHASALTCGAETSLPWFFSPRRPERCDRTVLAETLARDLSPNRGKAPAIKTVQREVAAVMQTYAVPVPRSRSEPEDNLGSPFHRLDLWQHLCRADRFERSEPTPTPPEALGLVLSALGMSRPSADLRDGVLQDIAITSAPMTRAGAMLGRSREALLDLAAASERELGAKVLRVRTLAGERYVSLPSATAATWARRFYDRVGAAREAV